MIFFSTLLISMFITILLIPIFSGIAVKLKIIDIPNERKIHQTPIPKVGGVVMALGAALPIFLWTPSNNFVRSVILASWIIIFFGMLDDFKNVDYKVKFAGQVVAALVVIYHY